MSMDWNIFWLAVGTAFSIVGLLGSLIIHLHASLKEDLRSVKEDIKSLDQRLSRMEGREEATQGVILTLISNRKDFN